MLDQLTLYIATAVASLVVGGLIAYAAATSERLAAPRRAKAPEDRTLTDKLIIEADRRIDGDLTVRHTDGQHMGGMQIVIDTR